MVELRIPRSQTPRRPRAPEGFRSSTKLLSADDYHESDDRGETRFYTADNQVNRTLPTGYNADHASSILTGDAAGLHDRVGGGRCFVGWSTLLQETWIHDRSFGDLRADVFEKSYRIDRMGYCTLIHTLGHSGHRRHTRRTVGHPPLEISPPH